MSLWDRLLAYVTITSSSLGKGDAPLMNVRGLADSEIDPRAEAVTGAEVWGVLGLLFRPRDQDGAGAAEGIASRASDDLVTLCTRDLRLSAARGALPKGAVTLAGYTGAHVTVLDAASGAAGQVQLLQPVPVDPGRALAITLDGATGAEKITIQHAKGHKVVLDETGAVIVLGPSGAELLKLTDAGGVVAGGAGADAVTLAQPVQATIASICTALAALKGALGTAGLGISIPSAPAAASLSSSKLSAAP